MAILSPTGLETIDYGQQFWNAVFNSNSQKENTMLNKLAGFWDGTATDGKVAIWNNTLSKVVPSDPPYPVPQSAVVVAIGASSDTTINTTTSKFFTLDVTKNTNLVFSNFSSGMSFDLILQQDAFGGHSVTASGCTIIGSFSLAASTGTWLKCYKVGTQTFIEVRTQFLLV